LLGGTAVAALGAVGLLSRPMGASVAAEGETAMPTTFKVMMSEDDWKTRLSPEAFQVLRHEATEYPGTSPLLEEHRAGTFACAGSARALFDSKTKYDSGTGWPSSYQPLDQAVGTITDYKLGYARSAVYCSQCGGHLGHVFDDGPQPTGLRYCMNG